MPIKWDNYHIVTTMLMNQIVIGKMGKDMMVMTEKSSDKTKEAVAAVYLHMKSEYERRKAEDPEIINLEFTFQGGHKLIYQPPKEDE